ncbi:putative transmembrane protein [Toxoplasma gondii RUB]|uniref:Putative transmembrane protein n=1 Tax=Toxoplasma gondii RUB TaxID=935652 RepID=A0A086LL55_TOXGO|nr:putative transmembrane protein [Toxoplasma gondii RUB]
MPDGNSIVGGIAVLAAILATGSVAVPRKLERIRKLEPPLEDAVYVLYLCCGYAGSAFLACGLLPLNQVIMDDYSMRISCAFTWWGALSGALVVAAINAGFAAISRVGMAVHAAISMGTAVVTSFLWGVLVNNDRLALLWVDIFAVVCLIAGSSISAFPKEIARSCESCCLKGTPLKCAEPEAVLVDTPEARPLIVEETQLLENHKIGHACGLLLCVVSGVCGGLSLGPMSFVPPEDKGIAFLPSFATGIIMAAVLALSIRLFVGKQKPAWHFRRAFPFGLLSGFLYMMAILAVIIAIPSKCHSCVSVETDRHRRQRVLGHFVFPRTARRRSCRFFSREFPSPHWRRLAVELHVSRTRWHSLEYPAERHLKSLYLLLYHQYPQLHWFTLRHPKIVTLTLFRLSIRRAVETTARGVTGASLRGEALCPVLLKSF